jgi:hypothetical protein
MLIIRRHLNKKLKMTLPTHPKRKTLRFIPLLTPVNSHDTLPLMAFQVKNNWTLGPCRKEIIVLSNLQ